MGSGHKGRTVGYDSYMSSATLLLLTGLPGSGKTSLARGAAVDLEAPVIGHDWVMAGLKGHATVWAEMGKLDHVGFRSVGWTVMWNLALAQLREGRWVVLDGVARSPEVTGTRDIAKQADCASFVVLCSISDPEVHRERVLGRERAIPNWPELSWKEVEGSRSHWEPPNDVNLVLDALDPFERNLASLRSSLVAHKPT